MLYTIQVGGTVTAVTAVQERRGRRWSEETGRGRARSKEQGAKEIGEGGGEEASGGRRRGGGTISKSQAIFLNCMIGISVSQMPVPVKAVSIRAA